MKRFTKALMLASVSAYVLAGTWGIQDAMADAQCNVSNANLARGNCAVTAPDNVAGVGKATARIMGDILYIRTQI